MSESPLTQGQIQYQINRQLYFGVVFSIVWLFGIGSLYSCIQGVRALQTIRYSEYRLRGSLRAWWCIIVGGLGGVFFIWLAVTFAMYQMGKLK